LRADLIAAQQPVRMMVVGYPGTAKTGGLASLVDAGYKLRVIDYDGNFFPVLQFVKDKSKLVNVDVVTLKDKLRSGQKFLETTGIPEAFAKGLDLMNEWKYKGEDGVEVNLGKTKDWGCDTVLVIDSGTAMGVAAFRRQMSLMNKTFTNTTQQLWGIAMQQQDMFMEYATNPSNRFNVIVLNHLKMIGPKDIKTDDDETTKELKKRISDLVETRLYPNALGQGLPPEIGRHFPILIEASSDFKAGQSRRVYKTVPRPELDLKLPIRLNKGSYPVETGLAEIFAELAPPLATCGSSAPEGVVDQLKKE
jgi:hypothetical protein